MVHGGSIGIGTIYSNSEILRSKGICYSRNEEKLAEETGGKGVDVILDNIGGAYFWGDINGLNVDGRLFIIGFQGGTVVQVNLSGLLARRLTVQVAGLQNRSLEKKSVIVSEVEKNVWPTITGVQVFSIDGSSRGSPAHGKQQAYWEDTAYSIILWL
ncbi:hypothetical protein VitviT2T_013704 [Vitis vinifera]|uniref:Alcohol dehydrogenase-like C-terminal domain-containing protein n=1 Tax=Vitis vinifera TaxID=29760 RepID=A0ABY9CJY2_VITVI|nr:hypothetical protein VitviT2T_013704 [Vitis vinifera]